MSVYQISREVIDEQCYWCRFADDPQNRATWVVHPEVGTSNLVHPIHLECANVMFNGSSNLHICGICRVPVDAWDPLSAVVMKRRVVRVDEKHEFDMKLTVIFALAIPFYIAALEYYDLGTVGARSLFVSGQMVAGLLIGKDVLEVILGRKREGMTFVAGIVTLVTAAVLAAIYPQSSPSLMALDATLGLHLLSWTADDFSNAKAMRIATFAIAVLSAVSFGEMTDWSDDIIVYGGKLVVAATMVSGLTLARMGFAYGHMILRENGL